MAITPGGRIGDDSPLGTGKRKLSDYEREVAHALMRRGIPRQRAIEMARGIIDRAATTGRWGRGKKASPNVVAGAAASVAQRKSFSASHKLANEGATIPTMKPDYLLAVLDKKSRDALDTSQFAIPETRSYPIPDLTHARVALAMVKMHGSAEEQAKVRAAVVKKYPALKLSNSARDVLFAEAAERGLLDLGMDGAKWKHGYIPLNAIAAAIKAKKWHGHGGSKGNLPSGKSRINVGSQAAHAMAPKGKARVTAAQRARAAKRARDSKVTLTGNERYNLTTGERVPEAAAMGSHPDHQAKLDEHNAERRTIGTMRAGDHIVNVSNGKRTRVEKVEPSHSGSDRVKMTLDNGEVHDRHKSETYNVAKQSTTPRLKAPLVGPSDFGKSPANVNAVVGGRKGTIDIHDSSTGEKVTVNEARLASLFNGGNTVTGVRGGRVHSTTDGGQKVSHGPGLNDGRSEQAMTLKHPSPAQRRATRSSSTTGAPAITPKAPSSIRIEHSGDGTLVHGTERNDTEANAALKAHGFRWSRNLGAWYQPRNISEPVRAQRAKALHSKLGGDGGKSSLHVGDLAKSGTAEEQAQARIDSANRSAERNSAKADALARVSDEQYKRAHDIGSHIPFGQPILVGHHSETRHRRDIAKIDSSMHKSMAAQAASEEAARRAESATARANMQTDPKAAARRLERNEAELRKVQRTLHGTGKEMYGTDMPATGEHADRLRAMEKDLQAKIEHDRGVVGEVQYGKHNVKPGDVIRVRGSVHVVHSTGPKNVKVHTSVGPLPYPYHQITAHGPLEKVSTEALERMIAKNNAADRLPAATIARIEAILAERKK